MYAAWYVMIIGIICTLSHSRFEAIGVTVLLVDDSPSRRIKNALTKGIEGFAAAVAPEVRHRAGQANAVDPWKLLDELDASTDLRNVKNFARPIAKFATLFARGGPASPEDMIKRADCYNAKTIARARVRLDIVAQSVQIAFHY